MLPRIVHALLYFDGVVFVGGLGLALASVHPDINGTFLLGIAVWVGCGILLILLLNLDSNLERRSRKPPTE